MKKWSCEETRLIVVTKDLEECPRKVRVAVGMHLARCKSCSDWLDARVEKEGGEPTKEELKRVEAIADADLDVMRRDKCPTQSE